MSRAELLFTAMVLCSCSIGNRIDLCDRSPNVDHPVNALTAGDQFTNAGRSLARLPSGKFIAVWVSESGTEGGPSEVRAALLDAEGGVEAPCGMVTGDVAISQATDAIVARPSVAVGSNASAPIFITWRSQSIGDTQGRVLVRLMRQDLCAWNRGAADPDLFTVSDSIENAAAPSIAVRPDGLEALVAWTSLLPLETRIRSRPVGISRARAGEVEANGCDGLDAPCTHIVKSVLGASALTTTPDGYALAWPEPRDDGVPGWEVRFLLLDSLTVPQRTFVSPRALPDAVNVDLALSADQSQLALATGLQFATNAIDVAGTIGFERFTLAGAPIGNGLTLSQNRASMTPAVHLLANGSTLVAWSAVASDGTREVRGQRIADDFAPQFTGFACDTTDFAVSSGAQRRGFGVSLAGTETSVGAVFSDEVTTGTDTLGLSVRFRRLDF